MVPAPTRRSPVRAIELAATGPDRLHNGTPSSSARPNHQQAIPVCDLQLPVHAGRQGQPLHHEIGKIDNVCPDPGRTALRRLRPGDIRACRSRMRVTASRVPVVLGEHFLGERQYLALVTGRLELNGTHPVLQRMRHQERDLDDIPDPANAAAA